VRFSKTMTGVALIAAIACAACGGGAARAADTASTSTSGQMKFFVNTFSNGTGDIIITGAIGDYGTTAASGDHVKVTLHHGTFELDIAKLIAKESGSAPTVDPATCSGVSSVTAPAPARDGKGSYRGIAGTVNVTETIAFILPRYTSGSHKNQCDNNTQPIDAYSAITGSGKVKR
jgi:ABC-type glycerol-3-phosphate transport system substrate-binding protein